MRYRNGLKWEVEYTEMIIADLVFYEAKTGDGACSTLSPAAVQWEAMTFFTESVMGQLFKVLEKEVEPFLSFH